MHARILCWNVLYAGSPSDRWPRQGTVHWPLRETEILEVIRAANADVVALQEWWPDTRAACARLAEAAGYAHAYADAEGPDRLPNAVLSRWPMEIEVLPGARWPTVGATLRPPGGPSLCVMSAHLTSRHVERRNEEARVAGRQLAARSGIALMLGDFNSGSPADLASSRAYAAVENVLAAGAVDLFRWLHPTRAGITLSAWRIDYAFATPESARHVVDCRVFEHRFVPTASDHRPLVVDLRLEGPVHAAGAGPWPIQQAPTSPTFGGQSWINPQDGSELVWVPADRNGPGLWVSVAPVTLRQYLRFRPDHVNPKEPQNPWLPAFGLTHADASAYARWAGLRLPTRAEWRRYAGFDDGRRTNPWGERWPPPDDFANLMDRAAARVYGGSRHLDIDDGWVHASPPGAFAANGFGLCDVFGNIWEYVSDDTRPMGGSWGASSERNLTDPYHRDTIAAGLRCVRDP